MNPATLRTELDSRRGAMLEALQDLVDTESPSHHVPSIEASAARIADWMTRLLGREPSLVAGEHGPHVHWSGGGVPRVLLLGHHDTVFPLGTVARRPFSVDGDVARGPGVFDMKGGIVQALFALAALDDRSGVEMLITADEEVGSRTSRSLIEERARACGRVLVLEPAADGGAVKTGRKGVGTFTVEVMGRAAHAGLEPEKGVNALLQLAALAPQVAALARPEAGTTVTPTVAVAGTAENVVPASASMKVDVRVTSASEKERVELAMAGLAPSVAGAGVSVSGGIDRPPMPESATAELFAVARRVAPLVGIDDLAGVAVGGGSDGNFTAAIGVPTLDGLGAVGGGAHAESEHVRVDSMGERAALVAALVAELTAA